MHTVTPSQDGPGPSHDVRNLAWIPWLQLATGRTRNGYKPATVHPHPAIYLPWGPLRLPLPLPPQPTTDPPTTTAPWTAWTPSPSWTSTIPATARGGPASAPASGRSAWRGGGAGATTCRWGEEVRWRSAPSTCGKASGPGPWSPAPGRARAAASLSWQMRPRPTAARPTAARPTAARSRLGPGREETSSCSISTASPPAKIAARRGPRHVPARRGGQRRRRRPTARPGPPGRGSA